MYEQTDRLKWLIDLWIFIYLRIYSLIHRVTNSLTDFL